METIRISTLSLHDALPIYIYVRVSDVRGRSGESFISPRDQEDRCRALATARGYEVGEVFTDLDVSGGKMARPELDKRSEEHTSELQSQFHLVCRLLLEKKK